MCDCNGARWTTQFREHQLDAFGHMVELILRTALTGCFRNGLGLVKSPVSRVVGLMLPSVVG